MINQIEVKTLALEFPSLASAVDKLLNKQEKSWGYFQIKKEGDFYSLFIPAIATLKLYQNPKSHVYKGYWRALYDSELPDLKAKSEKPDIYIKKKQKQVPSKRLTDPMKKQRILEITYRYNTCPEIQQIDRIIVEFIRDRIQESISFSPAEEIMPLILTVAEN
jgi:hypothetical protein